MELKQELELSDTKSLVSKRPRWKSKFVTGGAVAAVLLLGAMVSMALYFSLTAKQKPARLVEVDLNEHETLTYQVDQHIKLQGNDVQEVTIRAIVGIRVLNKTSEEYWFLMKFKLCQLDENPAMKEQNIMTDYFLVRLQIASRPTSPARNKTSESFDVFGPRHIPPDLLREVYCILEQLLPAVQRNLYEDVDGQRAADSNSPDHEESHLLPGSVKMHRQAVTSDKKVVLIKNHFDRADLVNLSSEIDFDLKYSDSAFINKSNGMITESRAYFSEELNFGEPIHSNSSSDVKSLKVAMTSLVTIIELPNYFEQAESERVKVHLFLSLSLPKSKSTFSVKETRKVQRGRAVSNLTLTPSENPLVNQMSNSTNSSSILLTRSRRSTNLAFDSSYTLFQKRVLGINVKAVATYKVQEGVKVRETVVLHIGRFDKKLIDEEHTWSHLQRQQPSRNSYSWSTSIDIGIPVLAWSLGASFNLEFKAGYSVSYPKSLSSSNIKFAAQIKPYAEATASIQGYLSILRLIRAGVSGDGTIVDVGLPITLSLQAHPYKQWCATVSADLTALRLTARVYYQWCYFFGCGSRKTLFSLRLWDGIRWNRKLIERCVLIRSRKTSKRVGWNKLALRPLQSEVGKSIMTEGGLRLSNSSTGSQTIFK